MITNMLSLDSKHSIQNKKLKNKKKNTRSTERRKTSFPKEYVENADLHKPVEIK